MKKNSKIGPDRSPGPSIDAVEGHSGTNPSDRSIGMPKGAHKTATEDKCDSSWAYLSSYIYHQPLLGSKQSRNLPRSRPPGAKTLPLSDEMGQIPATEALGCRWVPIRRPRKTSVIVVGHTYRVIYINSPPSQPSQPIFSKSCRSTSGRQTDNSEVTWLLHRSR